MPAPSLLHILAHATRGDAKLSSRVFQELGGEIREQPISKQSRELYPFAYWPGSKDPCLDHQLSTNAQDIIAYLDRHYGEWTLMKLHHGRYAAMVNAQRMVVGATPALALCGAAVRARASVKPEAAKATAA